MKPFRIFDVVEREETDIPVSELLTDGKLSVRPEIVGRGFFQVRLSRDHLTLYAGQYIGLIPLNERVAINVKPRIPVPNLLRLIGRSAAKIQSLAFFPTEYVPSPFRPATLLEPIASALVSQLRKLEQEGFYKEYIQTHSDEPPLRGRVLFDGSVRRLWSRGINHRAEVSFFDLTVDLLPNRVIKSAVGYLLQQFRFVDNKPTALLRDLTGYQELFVAFGVNDVLPFELQAARQPQASTTYLEAVNLALLILQGRGVQLPPAGGSVRLPSLLLDMAETFESYVRQTLRRRLPSGFGVLDGNREGARPLYDEKLSPLATPDFVICVDGQSCMVGDVKYKTAPTRDDLNQVLTYALRYSVPKAVLVDLSSSSTGELERLGSVAGIEVYVYGFALSAADLDSEETTFSEAMRNICVT